MFKKLLGGALLIALMCVLSGHAPVCDSFGTTPQAAALGPIVVDEYSRQLFFYVGVTAAGMAALLAEAGGSKSSSS